MSVANIEVKACDSEVEKKGELVCQLKDAPTEEVEAFIRLVRTISMQKVDWCYINKMPTVYVIGDTNRVMQVIEDSMIEFDNIAFYRATDEN